MEPELEWFVVVAFDGIQGASEPTIDYDARATKKDKANNICSWRWSPATSAVPPDILRVQCRYAGENG
jgi:hypothetical protein